MATPFSRTIRSLDSDQASWLLWGLALLVLLLGAWGAWMGLARITLHEVTEAAHLEAVNAAAVAAPTSGQVAAIHVAVGQAVTQGQVLFEIAAADRQVPVPAPRSGTLASDADLLPGAFVRTGDPLGTVIAPGELKIVADFWPAAALGRIRPGQAARFQPGGRPAGQTPTLPAQVTQVAGEARYGRVRVELHLMAGGTEVPLQHGMPGTVEVDVGQVTPAQLVLGAAGISNATP